MTSNGAFFNTNSILMDNWETFLRERKHKFEELYALAKKEPIKSSICRQDFAFIRVIANGLYGQVHLAVHRKTKKLYAIKTQNLSKIIQNHKLDHIANEKKIQKSISFPFCVDLEMSFRSPSYDYLCFPYLPGGDLYKILEEQTRFSDNQVNFYGAQILLALEYLHYLDLVHRDVKLENIVMDGNGYIKLTDFGLTKSIVNKRAYTFCGTPECVAPEVILRKGYGKSVDWWSFGILLFEMAAGYSPFHADDAMDVYEKIVSCDYVTPPHFSEELANLIEHILQADLSKRYGNLKRGSADIKEHPWFANTDWNAILFTTLPAPYLPSLSNMPDQDFIEEKIREV